MKRRDFLQKTALAGSALALPMKTLASFSPGTKPQHVIVIGAGIAGLAAAYALKKRNVRVTVLESQPIPGGRMRTHTFKGHEDLAVELGAEWIGDSHTRVQELCSEFNLETFDNRFSSHAIYEGKHYLPGKLPYSDDMAHFWDNRKKIWDEMSDPAKSRLDCMDWWRFLSLKGFSDRDIDLRNLLDSTDFGESIRHVSAYAAFGEYAESSDTNEMDTKIRGGNIRLIQELAKAVGETNIKTLCRVVSVSQHAGQVTVDCGTNGKHTADRVICAIPTHSVLKIKWDPVLPSDMLDAIYSLQYARIGKYPVLFKERFWGAENFDCITDGPGHYFYHGTKSQTGKNGAGVLVSYATGDKAEVLHARPPQERLRLILDSLKPAFGDLDKYVLDYTKLYWGKHDLTYGAYAIYGINQVSQVKPLLQKPHGDVHFAGEHLGVWQGFMEGAVTSGEEAAAAVMDL